jgi:hypothetical protein
MVFALQSQKMALQVIPPPPFPLDSIIDGEAHELALLTSFTEFQALNPRVNSDGIP